MTSQKPTSVRNKPGYIRLTTYLLSTCYTIGCISLLKWRIFGRPSLTRSTHRSTQIDKGHMIISFLMKCVPHSRSIYHNLVPRLPHSGTPTRAIMNAGRDWYIFSCEHDVIPKRPELNGSILHIVQPTTFNTWYV